MASERTSKVLTSETRKQCLGQLLPSSKFLFAHLSKYVSETESHAILNGIRSDAPPPEYDETISIGTLDDDGEPSPPYAEAKTPSDARPKRKFVEGQEMLTTTKKQQVEDSGTDYGVVAIKFLDSDFGIWWECTLAKK